MDTVSQEALLARLLLLEVAVSALRDARLVDDAAIRARREDLRAQWPDGFAAEELLDTRCQLAAQLEEVMVRARRHRRTASIDDDPLADAHEALALLQLLDERLFGR